VRALSCRSDDGRVERKSDSHDFWLILCLTDSVNGNSFLDARCCESGPFASLFPGTLAWRWLRLVGFLDEEDSMGLPLFESLLFSKPQDD
jgi:hypothetical protein